MKIVLVIGLLLGGWTTKMVAQPKLLHHDPAMANNIRIGLNHVYNFEFEQAQPYFIDIRKHYPHHPAYSFSQALVLFTKNFPMKPGHADYVAFERHVNDCLKQAIALLKKDPNHPDGIFYALVANSYQAMMHSVAKDYLQAIGSAKQVYSYIKQGFLLKKEFPDFYYTSGLFYYYASQYPETHPIVKPLMLFFEDGDKEKGLNDLNISLLKGVYTRQESAILLAYVYVKYENKPEKSLEYSEKFYYNYPKNPFALSRYIEGLLFTGNYHKAKELLPRLQNSTSEFYLIASELYNAILHEKLLAKNELAKQHYLRTLQLCVNSGYKTDDLQSFSYLGLGRIAEAESNRKKAILYYRKALDMAEYELVKLECRERLKSEARSLQKHSDKK